MNFLDQGGFCVKRRDPFPAAGRGAATGTDMCVLVCAMVITSVGLNTGSTAVIFGAMLIFPPDGQHPDVCLILSALRIPKVKELTEAERKKRRFRMIRNTIIILLPSFCLLWLMEK